MNQKFRKDYSAKYPVIASKVSDSDAFCTVCHIDFSVAHGEINDCSRHTKSASHQQKTEEKTKTMQIMTFMTKNLEYEKEFQKNILKFIY